MISFRALALASLSLAALAPTTAFGQTTTGAAADDNQGTQIIVTGTRRSDRTLADSPVPVDVIGSEQLTQSGAGETNKILNQLVPSFNFPQPSIADGTDALRPASLRGLSPDQTLVLINGKRRHVASLLNINGTVGRGSAAVDLNLIPGLAIDRIEVLRDGASSQYGSDAIAGVINIRLKQASHGGRASISYGKYITTESGVANITGLQSAAGSPIADPNDSRVLAANSSGERSVRDGELWTYGTNIGVPLGSGGFFNFTGEYRHRDPTNRAGYDLRPNYARPTSTTYDPRELAFNRLEFQYGDAKTDDFDFIVNAGLPIGAWEAYAFGTYGKRDGLSAANWRQQTNGVTGTGGANRDYSTIAPNTTPSYANFVPLTPNGFLPLIKTDLNDYAGTIGVRGDAGAWKVDLSLGYGRNHFDYTVQNSLNASFGPAGIRTFDAGGLRYAQTIANLDLSREYDIGFAKPLAVAGGVEYRHEHFGIRPGEYMSYAAGPYLISPYATTAVNCAAQSGVYNAGTGICSFPGRAAAPGAQGFPGIPATAATDANRHSYAAYIELDTDPVPGLTTTVAGRFEHFSDFGSTVNGKFAARFEPISGFALRGSISNGFRAPSLHQQYFTTTSTNFVSGVPVDILTLAVNNPVARAIGSRDLKPEKSLNMSVGATANPFRGLTITVDYYHIKIKDRIVLTENLGASGNAATDAAVRTILNNNGQQAVGAARFFINGLDTTTNGLDVVASYRARPFGLGPWTFTAAYNNNKTTIDRRINDLGPLATTPGIILFGRVEGIRFTEGQPRDKIVLSADGNLGPIGLTLRTTRYGRVVSPNTATPIADPTSLTLYGPDDIILSPKWISDLEVRFNAGPVDLAIGSNNIFDVYPDRLPVGNRPASVGGQYPVNQYYLPYSNFSPFGFNGRFVYARMGVKF